MASSNMKFKRGGRVNNRRRFQTGGHTHQQRHYGFHHNHQNGQTVYDPNNFGVSGPMLGYNPDGQPVIFETPTLEAGSHNHPRGIQRRRKGGPVGKRRGKKMARGGNTCPPGQHWMPPTNGRPGYCMQGDTHPGGYKRGGRMQSGGITNGASDRRTKTQKYDNKGRRR